MVRSALPMELEKRLANLYCPEAEWIGLREVFNQTTFCKVENEHPLSNHTSMEHGFMVEVLQNGNFAWAATTDEHSLQDCVKRALALARRDKKYQIHRFSAQHRPVHKGSYHSKEHFCSHSRTLSLADINDFLIRCSQAMNISSKIERIQAWAQLVESHQFIVSTSGSAIEQNFSFLSSGQSATAVAPGNVQTRSRNGHGGNVLQERWEFLLDEPGLMDELKQVGEEAVELLDAQECPDETLDLLLMPGQMLLQIHESIGHPLEIDRILGDERNYAGSSFVSLNDFGHLRYGSDILNATFNPTVPRQYASYAYDDNGCPASKEYLIKDGILMRGLGGVESQSRSEVPGVANARASSWNRPPIDRMANINVEPGNSSLNNLIADVEKGVLMDSNCSWSIDDYRRKFQFGCEYAKMIEKGKITHTLCNPNYRGITLPFWNNLKKVGNQDTVKNYGSSYCGKGEPNQAIRVGHSSPACLFEKVEVFGGCGG